MKDDLLKITKNIKGNIFTIGITDENLIKSIQNNPNVTKFLMLNIKSTVNYDNLDSCKPVKKIKIKKIRKKNKKKKVDYSICEISDCKDYFTTFVDDTIYFTKNKIYYYGSTDSYDIDDLIKKYRRYYVTINITKYDDSKFILEVDATKSKTNKIKSSFYKIIDFFNSLFDLVATFLTS